MLAKIKSTAFLSALICAASPVVLGAANAGAEETKIEVTNSGAVKAALEKMVGKQVTLRLVSGEDITGVLEASGPDAVRVAQLTGKEYYTAVVKADAVNAVIYRAK